MDESDVTLAELLAAYSLAVDLGLGQPMEHLIRSWQIAARLGRHIGMPEVLRPALFHVSMLAWIGCVSDAPEVVASFGDDIVFRAGSYEVDVGGLPGRTYFVRHAGSGSSWPRRVRSAATMIATGGASVVKGLQGHCTVAAKLADELGLDGEVSRALRQFFARWDGRGVPEHVGGTDIALPVRLFHIGDVIEVHHRAGGVEAARGVAFARRATQFDPELVDAFCDHAPEVLADLDERDALEVIARDPELGRPLADAELDSALTALADFTDLRSVHRAGHSRGVGELAGAAAGMMGLPAADISATRRAGFVHDIGLHGVPASTLDKVGALTSAQRERLRASAYYTERVLSRPPALARIGAIAATVCERMDGTGYHRGLSGSAIPVTGRVLAASCVFRAMTEPRAHRLAMPPKAAESALRAEVRAGRLDAEAADAVLTAAGARTRRKITRPAGLTLREVEVLCHIARGASTRQVAERLGISARTAGAHIEHIYAKTGASSRSTATLFALRAGLLDPFDL